MSNSLENYLNRNARDLQEARQRKMRRPFLRDRSNQPRVNRRDLREWETRLKRRLPSMEVPQWTAAIVLNILLADPIFADEINLKERALWR